MAATGLPGAGDRRCRRWGLAQRDQRTTMADGQRALRRKTELRNADRECGAQGQRTTPESPDSDSSLLSVGLDRQWYLFFFSYRQTTKCSDQSKLRRWCEGYPQQSCLATRGEQQRLDWTGSEIRWSRTGLRMASGRGNAGRPLIKGGHARESSGRIH